MGKVAKIRGWSFLLSGVMWYFHYLTVSTPQLGANRSNSYFYHFPHTFVGKPIEGKVAKIRGCSFLLTGILWYYHDLRVSMPQTGACRSNSSLYHFAHALLETNRGQSGKNKRLEFLPHWSPVVHPLPLLKYAPIRGKLKQLLFYHFAHTL